MLYVHGIVHMHLLRKQLSSILYVPATAQDTGFEVNQVDGHSTTFQKACRTVSVVLSMNLLPSL